MAARGMASERMAAIEEAAGLGRLSLAQGLRALQSVSQPFAPSFLSVMSVQWRRMLGDGAAPPAFLSDMVPPYSARAISRPSKVVESV